MEIDNYGTRYKQGLGSEEIGSCLLVRVFGFVT